MNPSSMSLIRNDRSKFTELIVKSSATKKLIVAGPGTGKTFTFHQALKEAGGRGLALTFINNLVRDFEVELEEVADAYTFHGFCKYLLHQERVDGLTPHFNYYPPLPLLIAQDMEALGWTEIGDKKTEKCFHNLDDSEGIITEALRIGDYYDTIGHTDSVYRVLRFFESNRGKVPSYPLVVVDEYQDFSMLETKFISLLSEKNSILIAGDDDQALYGFKHASASYIRTLTQDTNFKKFDLPYCSRCTEVIVNSVQDVLNQSQAKGLLIGRINKLFKYYPPDKMAESQNHPKIIHADCTVERGNAPYIGQYIKTCIADIPEDEIQASKKGRYPTCLVIGPIQFVRRAYKILEQTYPDTILKESLPQEISILDGYWYLHKNNKSRLGWRIVLNCSSNQNKSDILRKTLTSKSELYDSLKKDYRENHLKLAGLIGKIISNDTLNEEEKRNLEDSIGQDFESIQKALEREEELETKEEDEPLITGAMKGVMKPEIICTSLRGAKGLSASRVFIVGLNNGHLPQDPSAITDDEVCCFLVGLSRTRKQCYVISCERFGKIPLRKSVFLDWIRNYLSMQRIDKNWINANK